MLVPVRLPDDQAISGLLEIACVSAFVGRIPYRQVDVDHRFCRETRYRSGADMLNGRSALAQRLR